MALISLPYSLTAHSTAKASEVMADFNAILAAINGGINDENLKSPTAGVRRELISGSMVVRTGQEPTLDSIFVEGLGWISTIGSFVTNNAGPQAYYFKGSEHAVANKTTKLVLRGTVLCEHAAPTHTFKLFPVTAITSGEFFKEASWGLTVGAAVAEKAVAAAAAGTFVGEVEFAAPADGLYVLGFKASATEAHCVMLNASLFVKNV